MCGIVGIVSKRRDVVAPIVDGLRKLEYRGYDSSGIATFNESGFERRRSAGGLDELTDLLEQQPLFGHSGVGHTRWATHGAPSLLNAHPHFSRQIALVHNGVIENYKELQKRVEERGYKLSSETDSEVVAHFLDSLLPPAGKETCQLVAIFQKALRELKGSYALAFSLSGTTETLFAARRGSPLVIGYGADEMCVASDPLALPASFDRVAYLQEEDFAVIQPTGVKIYSGRGEVVERVKEPIYSGSLDTGKGAFRHYMEKEIHQSPDVIKQVFNSYIDETSESISLNLGSFPIEQVKRITMTACGTAYYAGWVARYWLEEFAGVNVDLDVASELCYRSYHYNADRESLLVVISQSGETADTLAALSRAQNGREKSLAFVNREESSIARLADLTLATPAGVEIGVASTKAFQAQLGTLLCFALAIGRAKRRVSEEEERRIVREFCRLPEDMGKILKDLSPYESLGRELAGANTVLYLGRGISYPIALEGALKLKEISYIHAEGVAAGEMKHGPIALVDKETPVVMILPSDRWCRKALSNAQEVAARGGKLIVLGDRESLEPIRKEAWLSIELPTASLAVAPMLYTLPLHLIAYYTALSSHCAIDKPRNLAKSVTVE